MLSTGNLGVFVHCRLLRAYLQIIKQSKRILVSVNYADLVFVHNIRLVLFQPDYKHIRIQVWYLNWYSEMDSNLHCIASKAIASCRWAT